MTKKAPMALIALVGMADAFARESGFESALDMAEHMEKVLGPLEQYPMQGADESKPDSSYKDEPGVSPFFARGPFGPDAHWKVRRRSDGQFMSRAATLEEAQAEVKRLNDLEVDKDTGKGV